MRDWTRIADVAEEQAKYATDSLAILLGGVDDEDVPTIADEAKTHALVSIAHSLLLIRREIAEVAVAARTR